MLLYTLRRILYVTPVAIGVSIICFLLVHLAPGDPLTAVMPIDATAEQQAEMREAYGFDRPLPIQYGIWLWKVLHGDLGNSIASGRPVLSEVSRAVGNSLILASVATLIGFTFGTFFGVRCRILPRLLARQGGLRALRCSASACRIIGSASCWSSSFRLSSAGCRRPAPAGWLGQLAAGHRASALHHPAGDHDVGDPDGHHRPHRARLVAEILARNSCRRCAPRAWRIGACSSTS